METRYLMSMAELLRAYDAVNALPFRGEQFYRLHDRLDAVRRCLTNRNYTYEELADATEELLCSLRSELATEIAPNWKRPEVRR